MTMHPHPDPSSVRLAEFAIALSLATDLGLGHVRPIRADAAVGGHPNARLGAKSLYNGDVIILEE